MKKTIRGSPLMREAPCVFPSKRGSYKSELAEFRELLFGSKAFEASLRETWIEPTTGRCKVKPAFKAYQKREVDLLVGRIRDYVAHPGPRTDSSRFSWLLSARGGGEGQLILSNISRNDLCCESRTSWRTDPWRGSDRTAHHSLEEMKLAIGADKPIAFRLFEAKQKEGDRARFYQT